MVNIQNVSSGRIRQVLAQAAALRGSPVIRAAASRSQGMSLAEAERIWAQRKADSKRRDREHRAYLRRHSGDDNFERVPPADPITHDIASAFVQAQFGPLARQERYEREQPVRDSIVFCHEHGLPFTIIGRR